MKRFHNLPLPTGQGKLHVILQNLELLQHSHFTKEGKDTKKWFVQERPARCIVTSTLWVQVPCGYKFMANPALEPQILTAHRGLFLVATWFLSQEFPLRERWGVGKIFHRSGTQVKCLYWIIIFEDIWQSSKSQPTIVLKSIVYFFR